MIPPCGHVHQQANNFHKISGKKRLHKLTARRLDGGQKHILRPTLGHWGFMSSQTQPPRRRQSSFVTGLIPTFTEWRKVTTQSSRNASPLCFSSFLCVKIAVVCRKTRRKATTLTTGKRVVPARREEQPDVPVNVDTLTEDKPTSVFFWRFCCVFLAVSSWSFSFLVIYE